MRDATSGARPNEPLEEAHMPYPDVVLQVADRVRNWGRWGDDDEISLDLPIELDLPTD